MRKLDVIMTVVALLVVMGTVHLVYSFLHPEGGEVPEAENVYELKFLFAIDDCQVHRFVDEGQFRYVATCPHGPHSLGDKMFYSPTIRQAVVKGKLHKLTQRELGKKPHFLREEARELGELEIKH